MMSPKCKALYNAKCYTLSEESYIYQNCTPPVKGSAAGSVLEDPDEDPGTYRPPPMHANKGKAEVCQNFEFHKQHNAYIRRL